MADEVDDIAPAEAVAAPEENHHVEPAAEEPVAEVEAEVVAAEEEVQPEHEAAAVEDEALVEDDIAVEVHEVVVEHVEEVAEAAAEEWVYEFSLNLKSYSNHLKA